MYALVEFTDENIYYVCHESHIMSKKGDACYATYTDGGRYPARILVLHDDRTYLEELKAEKIASCVNDNGGPHSSSDVDKNRKICGQKKIEIQDDRILPEDKALPTSCIHVQGPKNITPGAECPHKLTVTKLKKHIATKCINLNLSENEDRDVVIFMGHREKIHRQIYRQPVVDREILRMARVLELAQKVDENDEKETDDSKSSAEENIANNE